MGEHTEGHWVSAWHVSLQCVLATLVTTDVIMAVRKGFLVLFSCDINSLRNETCPDFLEEYIFRL